LFLDAVLPRVQVSLYAETREVPGLCGDGETNLTESAASHSRRPRIPSCRSRAVTNGGEGVGGRAGFNMRSNVQIEAETADDFEPNCTTAFSNGVNTHIS